MWESLGYVLPSEAPNALLTYCRDQDILTSWQVVTHTGPRSENLSGLSASQDDMAPGSSEYSWVDQATLLQAWYMQLGVECVWRGFRQLGPVQLQQPTYMTLSAKEYQWTLLTHLNGFQMATITINCHYARPHVESKSFNLLILILIDIEQSTQGHRY